MATTSARTLRLLSLLQTHRHWTGPELADRLQVSPRTLRRDVDRLRELGYPVEATRGVDGGYQLAAGGVLPPLLLDDDEAVALAIGLQAAARGGVAGVEESSVRALAKVIQVMPPRLRRRMDALQAMTVPGMWGPGGSSAGSADLEPLDLITAAQACRDNERLHFVYVARDSQESERRVEPHRLVSLGRRWYLVAFDLGRDDWRTFRVDRITGLRNTGHRFEPRPLPADDAAAFVRAGIESLPAPYSVDVVVEAPHAVVRERIGRWASIEDLDGSRCVLRMKVDSLDWPAMALGMVGAPFEVRDPPELVTLVRNWGRRFTRATAARRRG